MTQWPSGPEIIAKVYQAKKYLSLTRSPDEGNAFGGADSVRFVRTREETIRMHPHLWDIFVHHLEELRRQGKFHAGPEIEEAIEDPYAPTIIKIWGMRLIKDGEIFPRTAIVAAVEVRL